MHTFYELHTLHICIFLYILSIKYIEPLNMREINELNKLIGICIYREGREAFTKYIHHLDSSRILRMRQICI